jgi:hypothetical protein
MSGTLKVTTLQDGGSATANITLDASGNATVGNNLTVTGTTAMASSFKRNRIINGNMAIDQRNAGAAQSALTTYTYMVDRWVYTSSQSGKFNSQQNAGSVTPPSGFTNYLGMTVASAYAITSSDFFFVNQRIEGFNITDLGWGTASAKSVTLSFWAYSSLTGTFGGSVQNGTPNYSYPFTYSIPVSNTWTYVTVAVSGPTAGTWASNNTAGIQLNFCLGVGSGLSGTAGAWVASNTPGATGAVSVVGTSGATFYLTGVQLEVGTKATPYEMQIYSDQLAQCQRYYYRMKAASPYCNFGMGRAYSTTNGQVSLALPVSMRTAPTGSYSALTDFAGTQISGNITAFAIPSEWSSDFRQVMTDITASYVSGQTIALNASNNTNAYMAWNAEL